MLFFDHATEIVHDFALTTGIVLIFTNVSIIVQIDLLH